MRYFVALVRVMGGIEVFLLSSLVDICIRLASIVSWIVQGGIPPFSR